MGMKEEKGPEALFEEVLKRLKQVRLYKDYAMALCPFHDDHEPSLKLTKRGFFCFGCKKRGTLRVLARRLGIEEGIEGGKEEREEERELEKRAVEYIASRLRLDYESAKAFMLKWNIQAGKYGAYEGVYIDLWNGDRKFRSILGKEYRHFGNSEEPAFAGAIDLIEEGMEWYAVAICEGTFDALTFLRLGNPALSLEGKKYKIEKCLEFLRSKGIGRIIIAFDNDEAGEEYREETIKKALEAGFLVSVFEIPPQYKDVNEFFVAKKEAFCDAFKESFKNNVFVWYIKKHPKLLENVEKQRLLYMKLVELYDKARDKKTAHELLVNALNEYGLSYDEWLHELEQIELTRIEIARREEFVNRLKEAIKEVEAGADPQSVLFSLQSYLSLLRPVNAKTIDEDEELLEEGFSEERIRFTLLPEIELYPSDILLVSAKTKAGKTTLALNLFYEVLETHKHKALYVTYEINKAQLFEMFCGIVLGKNMKSITMLDKQKVREMYAKRAMIQYNLTLDEIAAIVSVFKPAVIFVDYDQQVIVNGRFETEERRVAHIVRTLKKIAVENKAIVVMLSQENDEERARYSREKEFYASVHLHLDKNEDEIEYEVRLNRYGRAGVKGVWKVDFNTRTLISVPTLTTKGIGGR